MSNSLFVVVGTDKESNEQIEYQYSNLSHAMETYNILQKDNDIINLNILEYDTLTKEYHMVDIIEMRKW